MADVSTGVFGCRGLGWGLWSGRESLDCRLVVDSGRRGDDFVFTTHFFVYKNVFEFRDVRNHNGSITDNIFPNIKKTHWKSYFRTHYSQNFILDTKYAIIHVGQDVSADDTETPPIRAAKKRSSIKCGRITGLFRLWILKIHRGTFPVRIFSEGNVFSNGKHTKQTAEANAKHSQWNVEPHTSLHNTRGDNSYGS